MIFYATMVGERTAQLNILSTLSPSFREVFYSAPIFPFPFKKPKYFSNNLDFWSAKPVSGITLFFHKSMTWSGEDTNARHTGPISQDIGDSTGNISSIVTWKSHSTHRMTRQVWSPHSDSILRGWCLIYKTGVVVKPLCKVTGVKKKKIQSQRLRTAPFSR